MRPKLIFLDLEGTLLRIPPIISSTNVAQSAWTVLAEMLGPECLAEEEKTKLKWEARSYFNYMEWMEETVSLHKKFGLNASIFRRLVSEIREVPGIRNAAERFHGWGSKIAIISGGFKALADKAQIAIRAQHSLAACEYFFGADGELFHWNLLPTDYEGKLEFMRLLIREYAFDSSECVFVGDGINDVPLAQSVGLSIAIKGQEALKRITTLRVEQPVDQPNFAIVADLIEHH